MSDKRQAEKLKSDWKEKAQNDAPPCDDTNLIELVKFLARRAAERHYRQNMEAEERRDTDDT